MKYITVGFGLCLSLSLTMAHAAEKVWYGGTGDWTNAANWSPSGVPLEADTILISNGVVNVTVDVNIASLGLHGGTLAGGSTVRATNGVWTSGTMAGAGVTLIPTGGQWQVTGSALKTLQDRALVNEGTVLWDGGELDLWNGAVVSNLVTGTFEVAFDGFLVKRTFPGTVYNAGLWRKTAGTGTSTIADTFNNTGTVEMQSGAMNLAAGGGSAGSFVLAEGTVLEFGGGAYTVSEGAGITGRGLVRVTGATVNFNSSNLGLGLLELANGAANFNAYSRVGQLRFSGGVLGGTSTVVVTNATWTGGSMRGNGVTLVPADGQWQVTGSAPKTLDDWALANAGTVLWDGGEMDLWNGAVVSNLVTGTFEVAFDGLLAKRTFPGTVYNAGLWRKTAGPGTNTIADTFNNTGIVAADSGTLSFSLGITESASATLSFGLHSITNFGRITVPSTVNLTGRLCATLLDGYLPPTNSTFEVMTFASRTNDFTDTSCLSAGPGVQFQHEFTSTTLLLGTLSTVTNVPGCGQVLFQDDFESYPSGSFPVNGGWQLLYSGEGTASQIVDSANAVSGSQSLRLVGSSCWSADAFHEVAIGSNVTVEVSVCVKTMSQGGCSSALALLGPFNPNVNTWGTCFGGVVFTADGNIAAVTQHFPTTLTTPLMPFVTNLWYRVRSAVDLTARTFDVSVDGVLLQTGIPFSDSGAPTGVCLISGHGSSPNPIVWFDDVSVCSAAGGPDVSSCVIGKGAAFVQTGSAPPVPAPDTPFEFRSFVYPVASNSVLAVTGQTPLGETGPMSWSPFFQAFAGWAAVTNQAELDARFPTGVYTATITTAHEGVKIVPLTLPPGDYPNAPEVENWSAAQALDTTSDFTLGWNEFTGGTTNDFERLYVADSNGDLIFSSPATPRQPGSLDGTSRAMLIPANTLAPQQSFLGILAFYRVVTVDRNTYPGAACISTYYAYTQFSIRTASTNVPPTIIGQPSSQTVPVGTNVTFCVGATGTMPLSYQWRKDGQPRAGATSSCFHIGSVAPADAGGYDVVVTNIAGSATSAVASLNVRMSSPGSLATARANHTATLLPNGQVLVAGGQLNDATNSVELYDPATALWTTTSPLHTARYYHTATLLPNSKVLVAGGGSYDGAWHSLSGVELYDPASRTWAAANSMNAAHAGHTATLLPDGKVLIAGNGSAELYDPITEAWAMSGTPSANRSAHTATLLPNGKVLVTGGGSGTGGHFSSAELYDPATGTWTATGSLNVARDGHSATLLPGGKVLVVGGYNSTDGYLASTELYDPAIGLWTLTGPLHSACRDHAATLLPNGKVLVTGGTPDRVSSLSRTELYDPATETWTMGSAMQSARWCHTATLLPSGQVLLAGGVDTNGVPGSSSELCTVAGGTWAGTGALNDARYYHTGTLLPNGLVLTAGGYDEYAQPRSTAELYDTVKGSWTATGSMPNARAQHTATLLANGNVLVVGGTDGARGVHSDAILYEQTNKTWTTAGVMNTNRVWHTATLLPNGKVLIAGGTTPDAIYPVSAAELYDPAAKTWTVIAPLNTARWAHTATLLPNSKLLVASGMTTVPNMTTSAELYDPATGTWMTTCPLSTARSIAAAALLPSGRVLVVGGENGSGYLASSELYDPATGAWTNTGALHIPRGNGHAALLLPNGQVLVAGGYNASGNVSTAELYDPATGTWTITAPLGTAPESPATTLLPSGKVLFAGGYNRGPLSSANLYDVGLGFNPAWQPQIGTITSPLSLGGSLAVTGAGFRGISEGSCGNSQDSPADYPLVQLRSLESGQTVFLPCVQWSANSFASVPVTSFPQGYAMATVFVNGIPGSASLVDIVPSGPPAPTQDVKSYGVGKGQGFVQTDAGAPVPTATPFHFHPSIQPAASNSILAATTQTPLGEIDPMPWSDFFQGFGADIGLASENDFDQRFPIGAYTASITTAHEGVRIVPMNLPAGAYPNAPHLLNWADIQNLDTTSDLTVQWDPFAGGTTNDHVRLYVSGTNGALLFKTPEAGEPGMLDGTSQQAVIPRNTLPAQQTLSGLLIFYRIVATDTNACPGALCLATYYTFTRFTLKTATTNVPPEIIGLTPSQTVPAGSNVTFCVGATGTMPLSYQWRKDGQSRAGATSSCFHIANVTTADSGSYDVVVTNLAGSATSAVATLTVVAPPQTNYALVFDGGDVVTVPNSPSLNPPEITVEFWVNFARLTSGSGLDPAHSQVLLAKGGDQTSGAYYVSQTGTAPGSLVLGFSLGQFWTGKSFEGSAALQTNRWYHLAGTYDGQTIRVYLDGTQIGSNVVGRVAVGNSNPLYLSYNAVTGWPYYLRGQMAQVRIWNYARSEAELRAGMCSALIGSEAGLAGCWNFDEALLSQTVLDSSTNGNHGTLGTGSAQETNDPVRLAITLPCGTTPGPPVLHAPAISAGTIILSWATAPGLSLQMTTNLCGAAWCEVPGSRTTNYLSLPLTGPAAFFRLKTD